jgi:hypothetical protein
MQPSGEVDDLAVIRRALLRHGGGSTRARAPGANEQSILDAAPLSLRRRI